MKNTNEKTLKAQQADILRDIRSLCGDNLTINPKQSDVSRFSLTSLEDMIKDHPNQRVSENHAIEYFVRHLKDQFNFSIEVKADRKLKISSVNVKQGKDTELIVHVSTIQVSYASLVEAKALAEKLIKIYDLKSKFLKFPTGNWKKTLSKDYAALTKEFSIQRYDGFDPKIANGTNIVCGSCKYAWTQINMGDPSKDTFKCGKCGSQNLIQNRFNYNYRRDNIGKHWGSSTLDSLLNSIDCFDRTFALLSKQDQDKILDRCAKNDKIERSTLAAMVKDFHDGIGSKTDLFEVENKATKFDSLSYNELKKAAKKLGYKGSQKKENLISFLESQDVK